MLHVFHLLDKNMNSFLIYQIYFEKKFVLLAGLEPACTKTTDLKSVVSLSNFTTGACIATQTRTERIPDPKSGDFTNLPIAI